MADTPSARLRARLIEIGKRVWGADLNEVISIADEARAGFASFSLTGNKTLTGTNYASNEYRQAILVFTDGGLSGDATVTVPGLEYWWWVKNSGSTHNVIISAGGVTASVRPGLTEMVYCDGTDCFNDSPRLDQIAAPTASVDFNSQLIANIATPIGVSDAVTKAYADGLAFNEVDLPGQAGQAGKVITTNGTTASWDTIAGILGYTPANSTIEDDLFSDSLILASAL